MCEPEVKHHFSAGLYAKEMKIPAGAFIVSHRHKHAHMSILASGRAMMTLGASVIPLAAPACIEIAAGTHHMIKAIDDCVWYCIHATSETDTQRIDATLTDVPDFDRVVDLLMEDK